MLIIRISSLQLVVICVSIGVSNNSITNFWWQINKLCKSSLVTLLIDILDAYMCNKFWYIVNFLTELVKEKNPNFLHNMDIRKLCIWSVDLLIAAAHFNNYRSYKDTLLLIALLSDVIPNPLQQNCLHIIVKVSPGSEDNVVMGVPRSDKKSYSVRSRSMLSNLAIYYLQNYFCVQDFIPILPTSL